MKQKLRKITSVLLVVIIISIITMSPITASALTQSEFDSKLNYLRSKYPNYSTWYSSFDGGSQCFGFARLMGYEVFGSYPSTWSVSYDFNSVKAGDIVRYGNNGSGGHSIFVTSVSGSTITFVDCNGNGNITNGVWIPDKCVVKWDNTTTIGSSLFGYSFSYIRKSPGIESGNNPVDLGTNFYASITHLASWNHLTAEENDNVDICWDNNTANQYWKFYRYDDGSYMIKSASTGKCLEVEGGSWVNGANIQVYDDNGTDAQRWFVYKCGNGYQLKAKCTDCVMEMNAWNFYQGVNLVSGSRDGSDSEIFAINWKDFNDIGKTSLQVSCHNGIANFSWNNARCATNYNIKIWNGNSVLSGEAPINLWNVKNNNFSINLGDGTYTAYIESFNKLGDYVQSSPITFNVSTSEYRAAYIKTENNHTYSVYNIPTTWEKAEEICKKLGGHLVTITSQDEQIIVNELLEYGNLSFYSIGGKRIGDSNNWEWINGEIFDFTNWATGEPNNVNNIENYLSVFNTSIKGYWNDSTNSASEGFCNGFICEVENTFKPSKIENYNGHTYSLFETSLSWENAKEFCEKSGGHLVTINDSMEQEFIENLLTYGEKELYWLGGVKEDDSFVWLDGKTITYDNYYDGEPNNYDNLESFLQISNAGTTKYKWNDNKNTPPDFSYGFIMETERIKGDVNTDGVINISDATNVQKHLAQLIDFSDNQKAVADTNGDGIINISDATQIQKYLAQLIPSLG
ncbi:MAG: RICIN domain-containing protein [Ruminococcus bromii]|nr:RICIN domain-containing protein [Ruminococcus bromii]